MEILITVLRELIEFLYNVFGDYGVSIVMVTVIVKFAFGTGILLYGQNTENAKLLFILL